MKRTRVLFIADPNSIHDHKWVSKICDRDEITAFMVIRQCHQQAFNGSKRLQWPIPIVATIQDPSTVRPLKTFNEAVKLRRIVRKNEIDLIHILYGEPNALWVNWKWLIGVPFMLTLRGSDILKTIPIFFARKTLLAMLVARQYRRAFRICGAITATSRAQRERIESLVKTRVHLVRTGIDLTRIPQKKSPSTHLQSVSKPCILMPRSMRPLYYHEFTLQAIQLLDSHIRHSYTFVFVDADTADVSYLEKIKTLTLTVDASVIFLPSLSNGEMFDLYCNASLVVMNPVSDGSPVSAMEAMVCMAPLILPPLSYDMEIYGGSFFFNEWEPKSLKHEIEKVLMMDQQEIQPILKKNAQVIIDNCDINIEMKRIVNLYEELLLKKP
ncbi:MAG TPA: glycosyltransferase family 4 protein [Chryseosolibacter sp.]|nr:glycosyltransferase family 4 protein [Chryseosolibacter sp.]